MGKFLITYTGGAQPDGMTDEQKNTVMKAWQDWYAGLGDTVVDLGNPTGPSKTISADGALHDGGDGVTGYSIINADSLDAAAAACQNHPHLDAGGSIAIYETFDVM